MQDAVKDDKLNTKKENTYIALNVAKDPADPFQQLTKFIVNGSLHVRKINTEFKWSVGTTEIEKSTKKRQHF